MALKAVLLSFLFQVFGLTLSPLRMTGGMLFFLIDFHMLQGKQSNAGATRGACSVTGEAQPAYASSQVSVRPGLGDEVPVLL